MSVLKDSEYAKRDLLRAVAKGPANKASIILRARPDAINQAVHYAKLDNLEMRGLVRQERRNREIIVTMTPAGWLELEEWGRNHGAPIPSPAPTHDQRRLDAHRSSYRQP